MMNPSIHPITDSDIECDLHPDGLVDKSIGIFPIMSPLRQRIIKLVSPSSYFDSFILAAIVLNSISIACVDYRFVDDNYQPSAELSVRNYVIEKFELIFTIIFAVECFLKVIAYGFVKGKNTYLRDGWNILDFLIVIVR